jgi:IS30 family transposase
MEVYMNYDKKRSYKHLDHDGRKVIERGLDNGDTLSAIARSIGVDVATVRREILRNRRADNASSSKGRDRTDCAYLSSCKLKGLCQPGYFCDKRLCKRCQMRLCEDICPDYERRSCVTTEKAPFVCNACARYPRCTIERYRYSADTAQGIAKRRATESRAGIDMTAEELDYLVSTVRKGLALGQSVHHIFATNDMPCAERSFYRYVENGDIEIIPLELAKKVKYKKRSRARAISHKGGFYAGHEYADYLELSEEDRASTTQIDTVLGKRGDKKCLLSIHRVDLRLQIYLLLMSRTEEEVVKALDWLEECSEGRFSEFFGLSLFDRGGEFDDIAGLERSITGNGSRMSAYFTDPSRPDQKGVGEKNHVELRKILPKGTSLDAMDAFTLAEICSHVNSTVRKGLGDVSPIELARLIMPPELFDNLGLRLVRPEEVIAAPGILYLP